MQSGEPSCASGRRGQPQRKNMIRRMLVRAPGLPEFKPDTGSYWLGDLGQIMSPSCASVSLGIHGICPTSFKKQHPKSKKIRRGGDREETGSPA